MVNQQLLDYVRQHLGQGVNKEQIKSTLTANGWLPSDTEEAFATLQPLTPVVPQAPSTPISMSPNIRPTVSNLASPSVASTTYNVQPATFNSSTASLSYAGFWIRGAAFVIDSFIFNLILAVFGFLYFWFFVRDNPSASTTSGQIMTGVFSFILWIFFFPVMESHGGATLGKKIVGVKVINADGTPVSFLRSFSRNAAKIVSVLILGIGFLMIGFTKKKQGLHDIIASCVLVRTKSMSAAKVWAVIMLIIVAAGTAVVVAGAQLFLMLSTLLSHGVKVKISPIKSATDQVQDNGVEATVSPTSTFTPLTKEEYNTYFSKPITGLDKESDYKSPHTYAGPALLAFDDFWGLNVAMPVIPNIEDNKEYVWIDLTSITSKTGEEILDKDSPFEKDIFFKGLNLGKETSPVEFLSDHHNIHVTSGAHKVDAKIVKGALFFKIPLDKEDSSNFYERSYPFVINI